MKKAEVIDRFIELGDLVDVARETWIGGDVQSTKEMLTLIKKELNRLQRNVTPNRLENAY
ncbi:hypothetical protein ACUHGC_05360 [Testudinibacter sp. P27/CKL/0425]